MRIKLTTLIDITETKAKRGSGDKVAINQQANYHTVINTIGLRVNIEPISNTNKVCDLKDLNFGTNYEGKQRVWEFIFENQFEASLDNEMLDNDFDFIPIITQLNETSLINNNVFRTKSKNERNIVFEILEQAP